MSCSAAEAVVRKLRASAQVQHHLSRERGWGSPRLGICTGSWAVMHLQSFIWWTPVENRTPTIQRVCCLNANMAYYLVFSVWHWTMRISCWKIQSGLTNYQNKGHSDQTGTSILPALLTILISKRLKSSNCLSVVSFSLKQLVSAPCQHGENLHVDYTHPLFHSAQTQEYSTICQSTIQWLGSDMSLLK